MQRAADLVAFRRLDGAHEEADAMVGQLDDVEIRHRGDDGLDAPSGVFAEEDVVLDNQAIGVAIGQERFQRLDMAAVTGIFAGQNVAPAQLARGWKIDLRPVLLGERPAVDGGNALQGQAGRFGAGEQFAPAIGLAIEVDGEDRKVH